MNNFTPEYIDLCKNDKVQELRDKLQHGDYALDVWEIRNMPEGSIWLIKSSFYNGSYLLKEDDYLAECTRERKHLAWLPTGDQLDDKIARVCKENKWAYRIEHKNVWTFCDILTGKYIEPEKFKTKEYNPLIAKIKLLIQLLDK